MRKLIGLMSLVGLLISTAAWAQVINGGFETLSASYTTGAVLTIDGGSAHLLVRTTYE